MTYSLKYVRQVLTAILLPRIYICNQIKSTAAFGFGMHRIPILPDTRGRQEIRPVSKSRIPDIDRIFNSTFI
jgi:hypothetical protein